MDREIDDEDLMLSYKAGDASAFEVLYQRHKGGLYRYILRSCKNESIAEELYQDVWMNLIKARDRYEVKAKFTTWLYQMAHNRLIDYYRRQQSGANRNSIDSDVGVDETLARRQDQPEQKTQILASTEQLLRLIDALPEDQKQAFLLREEAGLSIEEIAQVSGVKPDTVKSRLRYAINKLREGLKGYEPG